MGFGSPKDNEIIRGTVLVSRVHIKYPTQNRKFTENVEPASPRFWEKLCEVEVTEDEESTVKDRSAATFTT